MIRKHFTETSNKVTVFDLTVQSLQIQDSNNADVLLDSGLKLSNIIVILCSKLLDYILLKSGSISGSYYILFRE